MLRECEMEKPSIELEGLIKLFEARNGEGAKKIVTILLVFFWGITTILLTLESIDTVPPPHYGVLTDIIFLIVGRMWGLEVEQLTGEN